jgi:hypothetical protein
LLLGAFFWVAVSLAFGAPANDTKVVNFASFSIASLSRLAGEAKDLSGSINLAAALEIVSDAAGNKLPPTQLKSLHEIVNGRSLTLTATGGRG